MCVFGSVAVVVLELNNAHANSSYGYDKSIQIWEGASNLVSQIFFCFEEGLYAGDFRNF